MYFFHQFYVNNDGFSLEEKILNLQETLVSRKLLNIRIRELQKLRGVSDHTKHPITTDGWKEEELDSLLSNGLTGLSKEQIDWLSWNPVALWQANEAINEEMPTAWLDLILKYAKKVWEERPMEMKLTQLATNQESLFSHIRYLQKDKSKATTGGWVDQELEQVLTQGVKALDPNRQQWLHNNPVALYQLFELINEEYPTAWMPAIEAGARRQAIGKPSIKTGGSEVNLPTAVDALTPELPNPGKRIKWEDLLEILKCHVGPGKVTTYADLSVWAYGRPDRSFFIVAMLKAAAKRGYFELTNRVVSNDGGCGAADKMYDQSAQLRLEGVPFTGDRVDLEKCPPVRLV